MVINEWLLSGTEVLPDLMVWIIEEDLRIFDIEKYIYGLFKDI